jgi:Ca2+-transporting ATPase
MPPFFRGNPTFFIVMSAVVIAQVLIIQYGGAVFGTVPLSLEQWVKIIVASSSVLIIGFILRISYHRINAGKSLVPG